MLDERFRARLRWIADEDAESVPSLDQQECERVLRVIGERGPSLVDGTDSSLDEHLQERLGELAEADDDGLDLDAEARVVGVVGVRGPGIVRRARVQRAALYGGVSAIAVAASVALFFEFRSTSGAGPAETAANDEHLSPDVDETAGPVVASAPAESPACESWSDRSMAEVGFESSEEQVVLDLGKVAYARAPLTSKVYLQEATRCRTVIELESGRVSVHARDLGGGQLIVRSGDTEVSVRGTIFAVDRALGDITVDVAEGRVVVRRATTDPVEVEAGSRLELDSDIVAETSLDIQAEANLLEQVVPLDLELAELDAPSAPQSGAESKRAPAPASRVAASKKVEKPGELLRRAEALRQSGNAEGARRLYRQVGSGSGPTAEAAWLALARMELASGNPAGARDATKQRAARFGSGSLGPEALWISVRSNRQAGKTKSAKRAARVLIQRWPDSPQATAARRWLAE